MNVILELTDSKTILELEIITGKLRENIEQLLEFSEDENIERDSIKKCLTQIGEIFIQLRWEKVSAYNQQAIDYSEGISAFGYGDAEKFLLRYCLVLEQTVNLYKETEIIKESFLINQSLDDSKELLSFNTSVIKILRTLFQKQLINLIKIDNKIIALRTIEALVSDIVLTLPIQNNKNWQLASFYIQALLSEQSEINIETHRAFAALDKSLANILGGDTLPSPMFDNLCNIVEALPGGKSFIEVNILSEDIFTISPLVYRNFSDALKDELVLLHEGLEKVYLDLSQKSRFLDSTIFLEKLIKVLKFMGLDRLSTLSADFLSAIHCLAKQNVTTEEFNELVSKYWVLETFLSDLWGQRNQLVPLNYNDMKKWAYQDALRNVLLLYAESYKKLRERAQLEFSSEVLQELQSQMLKNIYDEKRLGISNPLLYLFKNRSSNNQLTQEDLVEVLLALEYSCSMQLESRNIRDDIINDAIVIIKKKLVCLGDSQQTDQLSDIDGDLIVAFKEDLQELENEFLQIINQRPITAEQYENLLRIAHTLKGNAYVVNLDNIVVGISDLEQLMRNNTQFSEEDILLYKSMFLDTISSLKIFLSSYI